MELYSFLRATADSWGLLLMFLMFVGIAFWAFRPGSRKVHDEIASSIFRNEDRPAADPAEPRNSQRTEA
ncbi:cbb3-type cytochrome c oxidase subunit 3 [Pseudomonas sp. GX19020]|uniref:cbb3-type cytochrome c oxidase subunit 3 n=1 Tax=Pseudomonadota TaxID=1224 RepID=UPI0008983BEA|nr:MULTISPECIES: cbb3-type cytochrome c oxidase subunit 3 [Pseudomonadota]MCL4065974.1 cbb3-type cytochrome c oxidase subunit 3 [Pseudomonas sp. GX19020]SEC74662.1 cytochrome c oxidase cbb3-type subunit 4 [Rhodobacter sp. 24-YEA-8]